MKQAFSIALLVCLLFTIVGHHILFHVHQSRLRMEMRKAIRSGSIRVEEEVFVFSLNDQAGLARLEWEDEHEFRMDGKMYDVVEKLESNGQLIIRCISDEKETELTSNYERINRESNNHSKNKTGLLIKLISSSYLKPTDAAAPLVTHRRAEKLLFNTNIVVQDHSDVITPPPQFS